MVCLVSNIVLSCVTNFGEQVSKGQWQVRFPSVMSTWRKPTVKRGLTTMLLPCCLALLPFLVNILLALPLPLPRPSRPSLTVSMFLRFPLNMLQWATLQVHLPV